MKPRGSHPGREIHYPPLAILGMVIMNSGDPLRTKTVVSAAIGHGDIGGFGIGSAADFSWEAALAAGYRISRRSE